MALRLTVQRLNPIGLICIILGAFYIAGMSFAQQNATSDRKVADKKTYLADLVAKLNQRFPHNRIVNIVCIGHSVPAGYTMTPLVDPFSAYPHLLHRGLKQKFPYAVINVIVSAKGSETSAGGLSRFENDVLRYHPDLITID